MPSLLSKNMLVCLGWLRKLITYYSDESMFDLGSVWLLLRVALSPLLWQIGGVVFQTA